VWRKRKTNAIECTACKAWVHKRCWVRGALTRIKDYECCGGGGATRPLPNEGAWRNYTEAQQSGHAPRSGPRSKMEEVVPKMACWRGSDLGLSRRRWVKSCRGRYKKNSPSVLSCIGKRTVEGGDRGCEGGTVHSVQDWKGPVPLKKSKESGRRASCEKEFVSPKSSEWV